MCRRLVWIASAAALGLAGTASAAVATNVGNLPIVDAYNNGTRLVQGRHYDGADRRRAERLSNEVAATPGGDACRAPEPSKLGLLRSNPGTGSKTKVLCRKLKV